MIDLSNFKVSTRLFGAFVLVVSLSILTAGIGIKELGDIQGNLEDVVKDNNVKIRLSSELAKNALLIGQDLRDAIQIEDRAEMLSELGTVGKTREAYAAVWSALERVPASEAGKAKRAAIAQAQAKAEAVVSRVIDLLKADKHGDARALLHTQGHADMDTLQATLSDNLALQYADNDAVYDEAVADYQRSRIKLVGLNLLCIAVAAVLGWWVTRSITKQLGGEPADATRVAQRVAEGDLSTRIQVQPGDTASLMAQLATMQAGLARVVGSVRASAESVATASAQIAQGNQDMSGRTEREAAALEETSATMDQLGSTVRSNAESAREANELALSASTVAQRGGQVVGEAVNTMKGINDSSRKIADIISVIDGIAFQTNILALNAAVEAARAGEQGRGFAVVASEVRTLAKRAADAAREIKSLINASVESVERGSAQVDRAGATMTEVVCAIRRVTEIMGEISRASLEQSTGVAQVGEAVAQMDHATQQNAALVEESAAAADSLNRQARQLVQLVEVFKLEDRSVPQAATAPRAPAAQAELAHA